MSKRLHTLRAERYALSLPARVRPEGHSTWRDADVVNVSRSGILLSVAASFPPAETLDLVFGLTDGSARTADVRCVAQVVRETHDGKGRSLLAASIDRYVFAPPTGTGTHTTSGVAVDAVARCAEPTLEGRALTR